MSPQLLRYKRRFYLEHLALALAMTGLAVVLVFTSASLPLDRYLYDRMVPLLPPAAGSDIVVVAIDEYSLRKLGDWPWDRERLADLLDRLTGYEARAVLLDLLLTEPDLADPEADRRLASAMEENGQVYLPVHISQMYPGGRPKEQLPLKLFAHQARGLGHVDLERDSDGKVREVYLRSGVGQAWWPHAGLAMLRGENSAQVGVFQYGEGPRQGDRMNIRSHRRLIPVSGVQGGYPRVSAADVLEGRVPPSLLAGRYALVGATAPDLGDQVLLVGNPMPVPGIEVNARILQGLQHGNLIRQLDLPTTLSLTLTMALLAPLLLPLLTPLRGLLLVLLLVTLTLAVGYLLLRIGHLWFPLGSTLVVILLAWPVWAWRQLDYVRDYLAEALVRLTGQTTLKRRLGEPATLTPLIRMLDRVLPVEAWRLEHRGSAQVQLGGELVPERAWQSSRTSHYSFRRQGERFDLAVLWRADRVAPGLDRWVQAMTRRAAAAESAAGSGYRMLESYAARVVEEERHQQALSRFFEAGLAQLEDGVVICDACGAVLFANTAALDWLDLTPEQTDSLHLYDLCRSLRWGSQPEIWNQRLLDALRDGSASVDAWRQDGVELGIDIAVLDVAQRPGRVLMLTFRDVTRLRSALRIRDEMLGFLSHDLRSPMISVLALAEKMRHSEQGRDIAGFLDAVEQHARRNLTMAEQFLHLARLEALQRMELNELDMLPVVESAIEQAQPSAQEKDIRVRFLYDPTDEVWVAGNHELLQRLVLNLLNNAIQHSYPGNSVDVALGVRDGQVRCEVRDRGQGMAPELLERIFEAPGGAAATKVRGAGFGLRFVKLATERHGGRIEASSRPGEGSRFVLLLPCRAPADELV